MIRIFIECLLCVRQWSHYGEHDRKGPCFSGKHRLVGEMVDKQINKIISGSNKSCEQYEADAVTEYRRERW